ncbi:MAG: hydroxyquinol 1,2-dioxygenase [Alphaproteobacteria bacterium]|nr:hydroxyquinol 1,2-dioxygenase [Alphaproteobacteria bacterium]
MAKFQDNQLTQAVIKRLANARDPRFAKVMASLVRHLHAFVSDVALTEAEWMQAIEFLTRTGQRCDDQRQEFILLSDLLGVSMLVDAINHQASAGETESTVLGPFFIEGAPKLESGQSVARTDRKNPTLVGGRVRDAKGRPIAGARIDVWQTGSDATYDVQRPDRNGMDMRGQFTTDKDGRYRFRTVKPASYPVPIDGPAGDMLRAMGRHARRPAHIHFMIAAPGYERLITHLFVAGDKYLDSDAVFGVKKSLVAPFVRHGSKKAAADVDMPSPFFTLDYDFTLKRARPTNGKGRAVWSAKA